MMSNGNHALVFLPIYDTIYVYKVKILEVYMFRKIKDFIARIKLAYRLLYSLQLYKKTMQEDYDYDLNCAVIKRIKNNINNLNEKQINDIIKEYENKINRGAR